MYVVQIRYFVYGDVAPVKPVGYMWWPTAVGAADSSGERGDQRLDYEALLDDVKCRCELMLTSVLEHGWHDFDN